MVESKTVPQPELLDSQQQEKSLTSLDTLEACLEHMFLEEGAWKMEGLVITADETEATSNRDDAMPLDSNLRSKRSYQSIEDEDCPDNARHQVLRVD